MRAIVHAILLASLFLSGVRSHWPHPLSDVNVPEIKYDLQSIAFSTDVNLVGGLSGYVTVNWSGVTSPSKNDWIALYTPSSADIAAVAPFKYQFARQSSTHLSTGSGSLRFHLLNPRADYKFVLFRNGTSQPVAAAVTAPVAFANYDLPMHPRLALTSVGGEMRVTWTSRSASQPYIKFGLASGSYTTMVAASATRFGVRDMCGAPASTVGWMEPGYVVSAVLSGLKAETRYYYRFGDTVGTGGFSEEFSFITPPAPGSATAVRFMAFGDMGQAELDGSYEESNFDMKGSLNTTKRLAEEVAAGAGLVLHIGDISYARGYASQWETFFDQITPVASAVPYMTALGNHERDFPSSGSFYTGHDSGGECGVSTVRRFPMPAPALDQDTYWYSFRYGPVHFLVLSTEHDSAPGSPQYEWFAASIQSVNRTITPWLIVAGHRPMYVDSTYDSDTDISADQPTARMLRKNLEALMLKYEVDLAWWGHHHSAQRTCFIYDDTCVEPKAGEYAAPVHMVIGHAGASFSQNLEPTQPSAFPFANDHEHGYLRVTASRSELVAENVNGADGSILDSISLSLPYSRLL